MANTNKITLEDLQQIIKDLGEGQKMLQEAQKETAKSLQEFKRETKKAQQKVAEAQQKVAEAQQETEKALKKAIGNFNDKWSQFMENLVREDLLRLMRDNKIAVHDVHSNVMALKGDGHTRLAEYDLVAYNGDELVVVETKTTLFWKDVEVFIDKLKRFKGYFSDYKNHKVYGAVAYMGEARDEKGKAAKRAEEEGLFVIKSPEGAPGMAALANAEDFQPKQF